MSIHIHITRCILWPHCGIKTNRLEKIDFCCKIELPHLDRRFINHLLIPEYCGLKYPLVNLAEISTKAISIGCFLLNMATKNSPPLQLPPLPLQSI